MLWRVGSSFSSSQTHSVQSCCCIVFWCVWLSQWVQFDCVTTVMWTVDKRRHVCVCVCFFRLTAVSRLSPLGWRLSHNTEHVSQFWIRGKVLTHLLLQITFKFGPSGTSKLSNSSAMSPSLVRPVLLPSAALLLFTPNFCLHSLDFFFSYFLAHAHLCTLTYTQTRSFFFLLSSWLPPWPPPWVIVVFRVRQEPQSFRPPKCLPGSAATNLRQLVWPNHLKLLWKTSLAAANLASLLPANGKAGYWKNNTVE